MNISIIRSKNAKKIAYLKETLQKETKKEVILEGRKKSAIKDEETLKKAIKTLVSKK